jgi:hypothetical protein
MYLPSRSYNLLFRFPIKSSNSELIFFRLVTIKHLHPFFKIQVTELYRLQTQVWLRQSRTS